MCKVKEVSSLNKKGMDACTHGDFSAAIDYLMQAEQKAFFMGATTFRGKLNYHLGIVHQLAGNSEKAKSSYTLAQNIIKNKVGTENSLYTKITENLNQLSSNTTPKAA